MLLPSSWRELLKVIIADPRERERVAIEVGVTQVTLSRWATGESQPRLQNARLLLRAAPQSLRSSLEDLLVGEYSDLVQLNDLTNLPDEIEGAFIRQVLEMRATTSIPLLFWTFCRKVFQHALRQLDSGEAGLALTLVQCMPPSRDSMICSLRETMGLGTPPWPGDLDNQSMFLGAESLAGYVVSRCRSYAIDDLREQGSLLPAYQMEYEVSAMAHPIMYANCVAGCLLVSSTQPRYFTSVARRALIADYAQLIALAFTPEQFYPLEQIGLLMMPNYSLQQEKVATLQKRIVALMRESFKQNHPLSFIEAELHAWQQIEEELLERAVIELKRR